MNPQNNRAQIDAQIRAMQAQGLITEEQAKAMLATALGEQVTHDAKVEGSGAVAQDHATAIGQQGIGAGGDVENSILNTGTIITGAGNYTVIKNYFRANQRAERQVIEEQVQKYLKWAEKYYGVIELRGIEQGGKSVIQLPLERGVYVPLEAVFHPEPEQDLEKSSRTSALKLPKEQNRQIRLDRVLSLGPRIIITGGPGCGKTTVLQYIIWSIASSWQHSTDLATRALGLEPPYPFPIYFPLNRYAAHLRTHKKSSARRRTLATFIAEYLIESQTNLEKIGSDFFAYLLAQDEGVILLLDGLDEVPTEEERILVREDIEKLVAGKDNLRVVVTSRTAAYQGEAMLGRDFRHVRVLPLEEEHVAALVRQAYAARSDMSPENAQYEAEDLLKRIRALEEEQKRLKGKDAAPLVDSPLMVRMLLVVAANERVLPDQRAELYEKTVDAMLRAENVLDKRVADDLSRRVGGGIAVHREMLQYLAFAMHQHGEQGKEIDEQSLMSILQKTPHAAHARDLIDLTRQRGTVLDFRGGFYHFFHLSFQEFLTARYLADNLVDLEKIICFLLEKERLSDAWWREVTLLLAGYLDMHTPTRASALLEKMSGLEDEGFIRTQPVDLQIAAAELAGAATLECRYQPPELKRRIAERLARLIEDKASERPVLRARAGDTLAALGDPRFDPERRFLPREPHFGFLPIPAGKFIMGSEKYNAYPQYECNLPYAYWMAKYPVTVAQFRAFVQATGYEDFDKDALADPDNCPVRRVSWGNALAYCDWLHQELSALSWEYAGQGDPFWDGLAAGRLRVTLPSEAEWEKAARGADGWEYPWGGKFDPNKANTGEIGIGATTAVGCFPGGASPYGCLDMSGNVWEWTAEAGPLRGGSFSGSAGYARCAFRGWGSPVYGGSGFRVVVSPREAPPERPQGA